MNIRAEPKNAPNTFSKVRRAPQRPSRPRQHFLTLTLLYTLSNIYQATPHHTPYSNSFSRPSLQRYFARPPSPNRSETWSNRGWPASLHQQDRLTTNARLRHTRNTSNTKASEHINTHHSNRKPRVGLPCRYLTNLNPRSTSRLH